MTWTKAHAEAFEKARWEVYRVIISDPCYHWVLSVDEVVDEATGKAHEHATYLTRDEAIAAGRALSKDVKTYVHDGDDTGIVWTVLDKHIPYGTFMIRGWRVDKKVACS